MRGISRQTDRENLTTTDTPRQTNNQAGTQTERRADKNHTPYQTKTDTPGADNQTGRWADTDRTERQEIA